MLAQRPWRPAQGQLRSVDPPRIRRQAGRVRSMSESEQAMQFGIIPPVRLGVTADPDWMTSFARHAEACEFESIVLVEHAVVISDYESTYPYASSGKMPSPTTAGYPTPST